MIICPNCRTPNKLARRFCRECGASLEVRCPRCGFANDCGDKFCGGCGVALGSPGAEMAAPAPAAWPQEVSPVAVPPAPAPTVPPSAAPTVTSPPVSPPPPSPAAPPVPEAPPMAPPEPVIPPTPPAPPEAPPEERPEEEKDRAEAARRELADRYAAAVKRSERRTVTILMAKLGGFAEMAEKMDSEEITRLRDEVFARLSEPIFEYEGYIDKFLGDDVMALFGAPIAHEDSPERALRVALAMREALAQLNEEKLRDTPLTIRMGVNTGPVYVGGVGATGRMDYTAMGDTVNLSARLETAATPDQILISENTYRRVHGSFEINELPPIRVKGKSEPVKVYEVISGKRRRSRIEVAEEYGMAELVGRDEHMKALRQAFHLALEGQGQVVGIVGEAGIGKSRLIYELEKDLEPDTVQIYEGRCLSYGRHMQWLPFIDIFRPLFDIAEEDDGETRKQKVATAIESINPDRAQKLRRLVPYIGNILSIKFDDVEMESLEPQELRERTFSAVREVLRELSRKQPLVLVFDDLQWADDDSRELLNYLVDYLSGMRLLLVCLYRPDFTHSWGSKSYYTQIRPNRLTPEETGEMVKSLLRVEEIDSDLADLIVQKAEGNPFFIEEITKSLKDTGAIDPQTGRLLHPPQPEDIPSTVEEILLARIDRLEPEYKDTLQAAAVAVMGKTFRYKTLDYVISQRMSDGIDLDEHLDALQRAELVVPEHSSSEEEYSFGHALIRDVAYNTLLVSTRRQLHTTVGVFIEQEYADRLEEYIDHLAYHYYHSERPDKALHYTVQAAEKAARIFSNEAAIAHYQHALEAIKTLEADSSQQGELPQLYEQHLDLYRNLGQICKMIHDLHRSRKTFEQMLALARRLNDNREVANASYNLAIIYTLAGDYDTAREYWEPVLEMDRRAEDWNSLALSHAGVGDLEMRRGDYKAALEHFQQALEIQQTRLEADPFNLWISYNNIAAAQEYLGNYHEMLDACRQCEALLADIEDEALRKRLEQYTYGNFGKAYVNLGNYEESLDVQFRVLELVQETGEREVETQVCRLLGHTLLHLGRYEESLHYSQQALQVAREIESTVRESEALNQLADWHLTVGQYEEAEKVLRESLEIIERTGNQSGEAFAQVIEGQICLHRGQLAEATERFSRALQLAREMNSRRDEAIALSNYALALHCLDRSEEALDHSHRAIELAQAMDTRRLLAWGYLRKAFIHFDLRQPKEAKQAATTALVLGEDMGTPDVIASSHALIARCLLAEEEMEAAVDAYEKAVEYLERQRSQVPVEGQETFLHTPERQQVYRELVTLLVDNGKVDKAQYYAEMVGREDLKALVAQHGA
ncbi:MAG TPA: tetratricopeptide repeat protein [Armatimonadetes bacterium]|nr:tetratricopeptide repeat protein [Armatimonadota bacterium]